MNSDEQTHPVDGAAPDGPAGADRSEPGPDRDGHGADRTGAGPPAPGAGTLVVLGLAWLLVMLSSARRAIGAELTPTTVTRVALELPQVIAASLTAGVTVGLVAVNLLARLRPAAAAGLLPRLAVTVVTGVATGAAVAGPVLVWYDRLPSITVLAGAVAVAATVGGMLVAVSPVVAAAGAAGALGVFVVGLVEAVTEGNLLHLFGAGDDPASLVTASGWVTLAVSLVSGLVAGALSHGYLRRSGQPPRWPLHLLAGAAPGLLMLLAELITRVAGARLFALISAGSVGDETVLGFFHAARINRALIVLFVGGLLALFLLGRTLQPAGTAPTGADPGAADQADQPAPDDPADRDDPTDRDDAADPDSPAEPDPDDPATPVDRGTADGHASS